MLFIRNHEREVELDEIKDAYEHEISMIIQVGQIARIQMSRHFVVYTGM